MSKIPKDPQEVFSDITHDYRQIFGENLISIILYGSAASGEYVPGRSDINVMIILSEKGIDSLDQTFQVIKKWKKRNVATPLFLTEDYVASSIDAFPIEYLNFQNSYQMVYGLDVLKDLTFDADFLRLQCEREIKGKLLLLRGAFVETGGKGGHMERLIGQSMYAFVAIFKGLLYLKGKALPQQRREVISQVCETFDLSGGLFEKLLDITEKRTRISRMDMTPLFQAYLKEVRKLSKLVDGLHEEEESVSS